MDDPKFKYTVRITCDKYPAELLVDVESEKAMEWMDLLDYVLCLTLASLYEEQGVTLQWHGVPSKKEPETHSRDT